MKRTIFCISIFLTFTLSAQTNILTQADQEINHNLFNGDWQKSDSLVDLQ